MRKINEDLALDAVTAASAPLGIAEARPLPVTAIPTCVGLLPIGALPEMKRLKPSARLLQLAKL